MKTFPLQIDDDLHRRMKHAAIDEELTLHEWVIAAINERLEAWGRVQSEKARKRGDRDAG